MKVLWAALITEHLLLGWLRLIVTRDYGVLSRRIERLERGNR